MATMRSRLGLVVAGVIVVALAGSALYALRDGRPSASVVPVAAVSQAPASPVPSTPAPSFDVVRVSPTGSAVLAGRAGPRALVTVQGNGQPIGQVRADDRGEWVLLPASPLPPGAFQLALTADGASGTARSADDVLLVVPARPGPSATAPEPVLAVLAPPTGPVRLLQGPTPAQAGRLTLDVVDYDAEGQIRFTGAGAASVPIRVYVDNVLVGDARTDDAGHWTMQPGAAVPPGVHAVRVDQVGARGQVLSRVEMPFQRADLPSLDPGRVVVQPGQNLWRIARQAYGTGMRYTVIYRANQDQIRDPRRIYPGQAFNVPGG